MNNIFYESKNALSDFENFKKDVIEKSYNILLEQKYKNGINHREPTTKTLNEIVDSVDCEGDIKILHIKERYSDERFQVVFVHNWYFAWCDIGLEHKDYFIDKYKLKMM